MIKFNLICKKCDLIFDSWFASSAEYEKLKKKKLLNCHNCNSLNVDKNLMAPRLIGKNLNNKNEQEFKKHKRFQNTIKEYQKFIKNNFDFVGNNFAYEARSIHYNKEDKKKNIYGTASKKDLKELKEEGIDTQTIPWFKDKNN
jgi:hypothetical protein